MVRVSSNLGYIITGADTCKGGLSITLIFLAFELFVDH